MFLLFQSFLVLQFPGVVFFFGVSSIPERVLFRDPPTLRIQAPLQNRIEGSNPIRECRDDPCLQEFLGRTWILRVPQLYESNFRKHGVFFLRIWGLAKKTPPKMVFSSHIRILFPGEKKSFLVYIQVFVFWIVSSMLDILFIDRTKKQDILLQWLQNSKI